MSLPEALNGDDNDADSNMADVLEADVGSVA